MSKMSDYCREVESLSKQTGFSMTYILERIDAYENELAEISMKRGCTLTHVIRQFVTNGFDICAMPALNQQAQIVLMGNLASKYVRGELTMGEYFDKLDLIKQGRRV